LIVYKWGERDKSKTPRKKRCFAREEPVNTVLMQMAKDRSVRADNSLGSGARFLRDSTEKDIQIVSRKERALLSEAQGRLSQFQKLYQTFKWEGKEKKHSGREPV